MIRNFLELLHRASGRAESLETQQRVVQKLVFMLLSPLQVHDSVQQADDLSHAAEGEETVNPCYGLIAQQDPEFVDATDFNLHWILVLAKVGDVLCR